MTGDWRPHARRWVRHLCAARRLTGRERLAAGEALAALALARLLVATVPVHAIAARLVLGSRAGEMDERAIATSTRMVRALARIVPFRALCLEQALAATMLLRRRGVRPTLHLGTARGPDACFEAHAWLTVAGDVVLGGPVDRYVEVARY